MLIARHLSRPRHRERHRSSRWREVAWRGVILAAVILVCATLDEGLAADDVKAGVHILTPGNNTSCRDYTTQRVSDRGQQYEYWALGFLSGINVGGKSDTDFLNGLDGHAVWAWLDNYCREHPLDELTTAVETLARELINRQSQHI